MIYVLRLKGHAKGHSFYEYMEEGRPPTNTEYMATEKFKYATEFDTKNEAQTFLDKNDNHKAFEIVEYKKAEAEYYSDS